ncbi:hypothetical protein IAE35_06630 [Pseudomonas sp. S75]|uniref:RHS repeat domain-containing protein n=1 Tax=unclassified Pseudomonas TaxID=196821 RepID=UPI0019063944|nr:MULTISPECIES: RHS repeat-associated core domain-containing protein [unclassified Pseudomonas]MBJ9975174.1 hypothetical protein [Pseudomonas sp. S30]MBK0153011.1 hypothetical protein [Pseudomonas sp. S75]
MSNEKMPVVKEQSVFEYSGLGLVVRCSSDQNDTYSCYYPIAAASDGGDRSDGVPALDSLLSGFKMDDETALDQVLKLSCPTLPDERNPPLLGLAQCTLAPDGSRLFARVTLFGYHLATLDDKGVLTPNTALTLENITVDVSTAPWTVSQAKDADGLRITLQQNTRLPANSGSQQTVTCWYKDNSTRVTHMLTDAFSYDAENLTHRTCTTTTLTEDGRELTPVLSQQVRSALSGLLLRESSQDELGRPITAVTHVYDARKRKALSYLTDYDAVTFTQGAESHDEGHGVRREETDNGTWVTVTGPDGRCGRTLYDGLQRPVRRELQRYPGADHSAHNYCLIQQVRYDARGNIAEQNLYDYLPGGLRRRQSNLQLPAGLKDWFWQGEMSSTSTDAAGNLSQITERTLGSITRDTRATVRQTLTSHADGGFSQLQQRWSGAESETNTSHVDIHQKLDALGRVVERTETVGKADGGRPAAPTRSWRMGYDTLGRKTKQACPDGMTVEYDYQGYAKTPTKLTVRKGDQVRVLGSQTLKGQGLQGDQVTGMTRAEVANEGALQYQYEEHATLLPDSSKIISEASADGTRVDFYAEYPARKGKALKRTLLVSFKRTLIARAISKERHEDGEHQGQNEEIIDSAALLGTYSVRQQARGASHRRLAQHSLRGEVDKVYHANTVAGQCWHDNNGLVRRVKRDGMEYLYDYTARGEIKQLMVKGATADCDLEMNRAYDIFGREISREYRLANNGLIRHELEWSATGQLLSKAVYRNGEAQPSSRQTYAYDSLRGWLLNWTIVTNESDQAHDSDGNVLTGQSYEYDLLANLTRCRSQRADGTVEIRDYDYHAHYATRRESVTITLLDKAGKETSRTTRQLCYDANGNLAENERGQTLTYTPTGRLASVSDSTGLLTTYEYDADDRLIGQWDNGAKQRRLLAYSGDQLCMETWQDAGGVVVRRRILDEQAGLVVRVVNATDDGTSSQTLFNLADPQDGGADQYRLAADGTWTRSGVTFSPWGEASTQQLRALEGIGFNQQRVDPITGCYHLGNGYRSYDPGEKRFQQPDAWSPFGLGGLNDRAYCAGDPVNWHDPSGHFMISRQGAASQLANLDEMIRDTAPPVHERAPWWEWVLMGAFAVIGVIGALLTGGAMMIFLLAIVVISSALEIGSLATRHSNPRLSRKLGYGALAVGLADVALVGLKQVGQGLKWAARQANQLRKAVKFQGVFKMARRSGLYVSHFDDIVEIGAASSKARTASLAGKLDNAFDLGGEARHIGDLVEDSLGITTWGGRHTDFSALSPNTYNAGGVYATVDHYRVGATIARNNAEIADITEAAKKYSKVAKQHKSSQAIAQSKVMTEQSAIIKRLHASIAKEHKVLKRLKSKHAQAFDEVTTLKGVHEELVGMRTHQDFHFQPNAADRHFGIGHGPEVPDMDQLLGASRPSNRKEIYDELIESIEMFEPAPRPGGRFRNALDDAAEAVRYLHPDEYEVVHPITGEKSSVRKLQEQYFRTTLGQDDANTLGALKKEALFNLAKMLGEEKDVKKLWALAAAKSDIAERHNMFRFIHQKLVNDSALKHASAVQRLENVNAKLGAQASTVHKLFDEQANAYRAFGDARTNWLGSDIPRQDLDLMRTLKTPMTTPKMRLNVYGHLDPVGLNAAVHTRGSEVIHAISAPRFELRVSHWEDRTNALLADLEKTGLKKNELQELNIALGKRSSVVTQWWGPERLNRELIKKGLHPDSFDNVRLVMCHGATGGQSSFASKFAMTSNSQVKAFEGSVTSTGFIEAAGIWDLNGLIEHLGHQRNAGALSKMESRYEALLGQVTASSEGKELTEQVFESVVALRHITDEAGKSLDAVYLYLAKHNNAYNTYVPRYFSPLRELASPHVAMHSLPPVDI